MQDPLLCMPTVWTIIHSNLYYGIKFIEKASAFLLDDNAVVIYLVWFIKKTENKLNLPSTLYEPKSIETHSDKLMFSV